jgi:murein DD-endopeptidase MepM/ murein hydrolase activator NlpD
MTRLARLRRSFVELFPERHLYVRSGGEMKGYVLTPKSQMLVATGVSAAALWMGVCSAAMLVSMMSASSTDREVARTQAKYERWIADRQARLNSAVAQLNAGGTGGAAGVAADMEKRHAALAMLLTDIKGAPGAAAALTPVINRALASSDQNPAHIVETVRVSQEQLLDAADTFAKSRADRLRLAFRLAGLTPASYMPKAGALGGPLIESKDPRALAAVLDVDESFADRIQHAAIDMNQAKALEQAAHDLPFAKPTDAERSSSFGVRVDPFTGHPAFHSGQDFSGYRMETIHATGPGVVAFTGVRSGYGNCVEIDHGRGLKTRYAHLAAIAVTVGQQVAVGQRLGGMGSTGRSTGTHLHYEVWLNGRAMNPDRFLKAGDYVQQAE